MRSLTLMLTMICLVGCATPQYRALWVTAPEKTDEQLTADDHSCRRESHLGAPIQYTAMGNAYQDKDRYYVNCMLGRGHTIKYEEVK